MEHKIALQDICVQTLLRPYNVEFSRELTLQNSELCVMYPEQSLSKIMNEREKADRNVTLIIYSKENTFLSHVKVHSAHCSFSNSFI